MDSSQNDEVTFEQTPTHIAAPKATTTPPAGSSQDESSRPVVAEQDPSPPSRMIAVPKRDLEVRGDGALALTSIDDQLKFAQKLINEGMVSSTFKTPAQVVIAFQYAKALKLNELLGIKMMYVVNGRPCLYGEGPLALCQRTGLVQIIEEFYLDEEYEQISVLNKNLKATPYAAITRLKRKGDAYMQEDYFTLDDLKNAGLDVDRYGKTKDVWAKWMRIMLRYKARTIALRTKFADIIAGVPIAEYDFHFTPEEPTESTIPRNSAAAELNATYLPKSELAQ